MAYFNASRKMPQDPDNLFSICQWAGESLKEYMVRFKTAMMEIYHLDEVVAMPAMKRLHPSRFIYSLDKTYFMSYLELLTCTQKYIRVEKGALTWCEADGKLKRKQA